MTSDHNIPDWDQPLPLKENPLLEWPLGVFPEPFEMFIRDLSRSTETPIELSALLTLASVSTASQKHYRIQIKPDYSEPVNIWVMVALPPASRKSRVYEEITSPLREWEKEQRQLMEPLVHAANSKRKTMEARIKELRLQAAKVTEDKYFEFQSKIEYLEKELPEIPNYPQIWTGDVTPENLGTIMAANEGVMAALSDEGGIFDILSGLYSDGKANIDLLLQSHSGSPFRVDRGSRPPIFLERALLTVGLTVQPLIIRNICKNKTFRGRGLLGRFLYAIPKSNIGTRNFDEPPVNNEYVLNYRQAVQSILNNSNSNNQHILNLSPEAYRKWQEYAKAIELMMGEDVAFLSHITDWAGKLAGAIARIAALLHIMRYAHQSPWEQPVSIEDMTFAIKIGHALINHALTILIYCMNPMPCK